MEEMRFAVPADAPDVRGLWDIAFGEDADFNDWYFKNKFDTGNTLLSFCDGTLAAMVQMPVYEIKGIGRLTYIYGAATRPDLRGRGIMTRLIEKSFALDKQNGMAGSMLIPADKGLFAFYKRLGYSEAFFVRNSIYTAAPAEMRRADKSDTALLNRIYETSLLDLPHPVRDEGYWHSQIDMFNALGGYVYTDGKAYAFGMEDGIQELMGQNAGELAAGIALKLKKPAIKAAEQGGDTSLGMVRLYDGQIDKMYFNLMYN